jgi:hypothetical protein
LLLRTAKPNQPINTIHSCMHAQHT